MGVVIESAYPKMVTLDGRLPYSMHLPRSGVVQMEKAHLLPHSHRTLGTITHLSHVEDFMQATHLGLGRV